MGINFALARRKFNKAQERLRKQYEAAGMTEDQIQAIYEYDLHQFNRDLAYRRHTQRLGILEEPEMEEESHNPLMHKFFDQLTVCQQPSEEGALWWLDEIENETLIKNLMQLSGDELELLHKLAFCDYTQTELSNESNKSQSAISQKLNTIRKKIKISE